MPNTFTWNGQSSADFGIYIENRHTMNRSQRKFESTSVHGRNGNIYEMQNAWEEVIVSYDIFVGDETSADIVAPYTDIMEWLNSADGYAELTDTYDPDHYRQAVFVDAVTIEPVNTHSNWYALGQASISFRCRPERYLAGQEEDYPTSQNVEVTNTTNHDAHPLLKVYGSGVRSMLNLNNRIMFPSPISDPYTTQYLGFLILSMYNGYQVVKRTGNKEIQVSASSKLSVGSITNTNGVLEFTVTSAAQDEDWGVGIIQEVQGNSDYTISCEAYNGGYLQVMCAAKSGDSELLQTFTATSSGTGWKSTSLTFHTPSECGYILIIFTRLASHSTTLQRYRKIMLNKGTEAKPFNIYSADISSAIKFAYSDSNSSSMKMTISESFDVAEIDCERENVAIDGVNANQFVTIEDGYGNISENYLLFPKQIETDITLSGDAVGVKIDPRFWKL